MAYKQHRNRDLKEIQKGLYLTFKIANSLDLEYFIDVVERDLTGVSLDDEHLVKVLRGGGKKWVRLAEVLKTFRDDSQEILTK